MDKYNGEIMKRVLEAAEANVTTGGGPFAAAVVSAEGEIISCEANCVVPTCDPSAHAEVTAIRVACRKVGTHDLSGCTVYTSCYPCPMCLGCIYWAHVSTVYYAATAADAAAISFDDEFIYTEIAKPMAERSVKFIQAEEGEARLGPFKRWTEATNKVHY